MQTFQKVIGTISGVKHLFDFTIYDVLGDEKLTKHYNAIYDITKY